MLKQILAIVLAWTPTWYPAGKGPETEEQRAARRSMVGEVIAERSQRGATELWPQDEASLVMTIFRFESGSLDYYVHGGEPSPIGDGDEGNSLCLGQIQHVERWWSLEEWRALAGRDRAATVRCTDATLRVIAHHVKRCKLREDLPEASRWRAPLTHEEAGIIFNAYATGISCKPGRQKRVKYWSRVRKKLP